MEIDIQMISEILYESLMHPLTMAPLLGIKLVLGAVIGVLVKVVGKVMGDGKTIDEVAHRTDGPYEIDGATHGEQVHTCEPSDGRESVHASDAGLGYGDLSPTHLDHVHADDHRHEYTPDCADHRTHDHAHGCAHDHAHGGSCVGESASPKEYIPHALARTARTVAMVFVLSVVLDIVGEYAQSHLSGALVIRPFLTLPHRIKLARICLRASRIVGYLHRAVESVMSIGTRQHPSIFN